VKLLLLGFNTRSLAESAAAAGYSFISLDWFGDLDHGLLGPVFSLRRLQSGLPGEGRPTMERMVEWGIILARREQCDSLVYASGLENRPELVAKLVSESGCRLYGNPPPVLQQVRNPVALSQNLRQAGFHAPETRRPEGAQFGRGRRWLIKPVKSGGGRRVAPASQDESAREGSICQEYISGKPCSFTFVADGSHCLVLGITEQLIAAKSSTGREFGYAGNLFPLTTGETRKLYETAVGIAGWLTAKYGLRGLNGVDFILRGKDCWVIEVNPRYSASMELLERAYGFPVIRLHLLACSGDWQEVKSIVERLPVELTLSQPECIWGKKVIYTRMPKLVRPTYCGEKKEEHEQTWARRMHARGLRDLPFPGEIIRARNPVATATASGATRADCLKTLERLSLLMRSQLSPPPAPARKPQPPPVVDQNRKF
jgi:predicted ATP-grasp superfamily ATP-dependent carboligase